LKTNHRLFRLPRAVRSVPRQSCCWMGGAGEEQVHHVNSMAWTNEGVKILTDPLLQMTKCPAMGRGLLRGLVVSAEHEFEAVVSVAQRMLRPVRLCPKVIGRGLEFGA